MKKLFVLSTNCGDGSFSVQATFDQKLIKKMEKMYKEGELDSERFCDGDGFHYQTWNLPDECTVESVGFYELTEDSI